MNIMNINKKLFLALLFLFSLNNQAKSMFLVENLIKVFLSPNSLLIANATSNCTDGIKEAIEKGADINTQNNELRTALHLVIWHKNIEAFIFLIENGINIRIREEDGHTALHVAASINSPRITKILIQRSGEDSEEHASVETFNALDYINEENNSGNTPLHLAALQNSNQSAKILIHFGADVNKRNEAQKTPLHYAVIRENIEMIKLLIISGAETNIRDRDRITPLSYANPKIKKIISNLKREISRQREKEELEIRLRELEIVRLEKERLLHEQQEEQRIYTQNITDVQSQLKSHLQQKRFNQETTAITNIQNQLRKYLEQNKFRNSIQISRMKNDPEYKTMKFRKNFLSLLDNFLLDINGPINILSTKEELLAEFKQILSTNDISIFEEEEISLKYLVGNFIDMDGNTALHLFAMYGKHQFIPALILNGINVNTQNDIEETPLQLAEEFNNTQAAEVLLLLGANTNAQTESFNQMEITPNPINVDTEIEEKINNFIEWIQENNDIDFSLIMDKNKNNIFHYMAKYNHPQLTRLINIFFGLGVDIHAKNKRGFTPIHIALFYGNIETAKAFVG